MTKFILHGGFTSIPNELNRSFYRECSSELSDGGTILLVYFARNQEDVLRLFEEDKGRILEQASAKNLNMVLAERENFIEQLKASDAVYIRGGDIDKLLEALKHYPDLKNILKEKKIVSGSSAGAYVLAKYYHSASKGGVHEGLGLLPIRVICHFRSDRFEDRGKPVEDMEKYPNNLELVVLKDCEWKSLEL